MAKKPDIFKASINELLGPYWDLFHSEDPELRVKGAEGLLKHKALLERGVYAKELRDAEERERESELSKEEREALAALRKLEQEEV